MVNLILDKYTIGGKIKVRDINGWKNCRE
jgi:hypothetical protein